MKRILLLFSIGMYTLSMAGCGSPLETSPASGLSGSGSGASQTAAEPEESSRETSSAAVTLYIGLEGEFAEYQVNYTGERAEDGRIPAAQVLSAMTELTGWNLDLTVPVESGKDGVTVTFADTCTLLSGGSDGETAEDIRQRDRMVLDSVKRTLQCWAEDPEQGDPDSVEIRFRGPDGGDLHLTGTGIVLSSAEPYQSFPRRLGPV